MLVDGSICISGTGSLNSYSFGEFIDIDGLNEAVLSVGGSVEIVADTDNNEGIHISTDIANLVIKDSASITFGTEDAPFNDEGLYLLSNISSAITITDNAVVYIETDDEEGIYLNGYTENLTISGNATVYVKAQEESLDSAIVNISGGTVTTIGGSEDDGIYAEYVNISGGTVKADGGFSGINCIEVNISGGTVTVEGGHEAIDVEDCVISGGMVTVDAPMDGIYALNTLTVTGGTLEVLNGGIYLVNQYGNDNAVNGEALILGEHISITEPVGAEIRDDLIGYECYTGVVGVDGFELESFTISCTHSWKDGICESCGTPFTVTAKSFSLSFENEILVNLYYSVYDTAQVTEHGLLVFQEMPEIPSVEDADWVFESLYDPETDRYMGQTDGIPAKKMGDERYYVAYVKLENGTYAYSDAYAYSPAIYAYKKIGAIGTSEELKALCVAMLNYGSQAQTYFGYKTDALMNADLTEDQQELAADFDWSLLTGAVASEKATTFVKTEGFSKRQASVSFDGVLAINYYFTPVAENGDITFYYWTAADYANAQTLAADNATGSMTMLKGAGDAYWAQVGGIAAKQIDETVYVAAVYTDADGNTSCSGIVAYSISEYCMSRSEGNMGDLAYATAAYGYFAASYFGE
jgi:hypothetical protein